jgi:hypothetical protein
VQVLHAPKKFERPPFWNGWRYGIKKYGVEVSFNGMTSPLNFIKIDQLVQKLLGGGQTDRQTGDLISLTFLFEESRLKNESRKINKMDSSCTAKRQEEISHALVRMISMNMMPISFLQ